jgi:methylthioribose-1-phosphate isomerase
VRVLHQRGELSRVYADESRPLLQGARLTAWELDGLGIDYRVLVDGAGPSLIARGLVDAVIVGADRVAANGDVANKVGTYPLALAAGRAGVPFVVAAPESTVDPATPDGDAIEIEDRGDDEVVAFGGQRVAPAGARAVNPAFDVTPADLVTAVVTEHRVVRPAAGERLV